MKIHAASATRQVAVIAAVLIGAVLLVPAAPAAGKEIQCRGRNGDTGGIGHILSVKGLRCLDARGYYARNRGDSYMPIRKGRTTRFGSFKCRVYRDLTPPGPSDVWVYVLCERGRQTFRVNYGP